MAQTKIRGSSQIIAGTITNTEINSAAAIATSKLQDGSLFIQSGGGVAFTNDQSMGSHKLTNVTDPSSPQDAATKNYVDGVAQGLDVKASVRAATTANITLSGTQTVDGVALSVADRVLVKNQTTGANNGIYLVASGSWTRTTDADTSAKVTPGMFVFVEEGTVNGDSGWVLITDAPITLATTSLSFTQFTGSGTITGGAGIVKTGSTLDVVAGDASILVNADELHVQLTGSTLAVSGGLKVASGGITGTELNTSVAGAGLTGGGGSVLAIGANADSSIVVNTDDIQVKRDAAGAIGVSASGIAVAVGTGIEISSNALRIATAAAGTGLTYTAGVLSITDGRNITRETPTGAVDSSNTSYTLAHTPIAASEQVYLNGILQEPGAGNDYTISAGTVTYLSPPTTGDRLRVSYRW